MVLPIIIEYYSYNFYLSIILYNHFFIYLFIQSFLHLFSLQSFFIYLFICMLTRILPTSQIVLLF
ncbi:MAG TPA: hypothetical protein DHW61_01385 [Lachnoclostridium phytofermentans]|uniref:Uncharacterized protein n=1 Tax=Lachnoclostridium phytofermentans TaxID=66219 RepID=A0A3D2X367_9FIRM|nr:hypothetical protein [Lachnoclostridium phytofermentans]